jgi:propionaldehyde dehydrogenase
VEDAIDAAYEAQRKWAFDYKVEDRRRIIEAIRVVTRENAESLAKMVQDETGMGRWKDKVLKHLVVADKTPGVECLTTDAISGDEGLMIEEYAPFGVIGAITPSTNPTETIINNTISMIAGGNAVVFNVHPGAKRCCAHCLQLLHKTIVANGGPANLITMQKEPTMDAVNKLTASPKIRLMTGTGGMGMVNALLRSGKKTIGAGAGNPPVIVDDTADVKLAAKELYWGASFDNNLFCFAEKEVFVMDAVADGLIRGLVEEGAYLLNSMQLEEIVKFALIQKNGSYEVNKKWVGKDASLFLREIGVTNRDDTRLLICEVGPDHPYVMVEQLMPVLPIVRCHSFDECVRLSVRAEQGNRHTASIFSTNVYNMTRFGKEIETTIYVKNGATLRGLAVGGEGHTTMTIAGPTGEGLTCAKSFTRRRRCMLAEGGLRIV